MNDNNLDINIITRNSALKKYFISHPHEGEKVLFPRLKT